ncbi:MAG TPA: nuclear transport factor 2 family protein [Anaerolineales bacterium]|nr:nuclear transport factor 2 family protein [Anaerolineales bacterium]
MNTKRFSTSLLSLLVTSALLLSACGPRVTVTASQDPVTVVENFYEIINMKDVEQAMTLTADDYVLTDTFGTYDKSVAAIQWQAAVDADRTFKQTDLVDTGNGRVTSCYEIFENGKSIDRGCGKVSRVREGKIIFDGLLPAEGLWIVQQYYGLINAGDLEASMSFIADDVKCRGACYLTGKAAYQMYIQGIINGGGRKELRDFAVDGDKVTYYWAFYKKDGRDVVISGIEFMQFKDGKIILIESDFN